MELIKSFTVNHDTLKEGVYISRTDRNTITYDLRMKIPNSDDYLSPPQAHTLEHLCATYLRNSVFKNEIVYFGPMGCMTGFYLVTFDTFSPENMLKTLCGAMKFVSNFSETEIPGAKRIECGNYKSHDLIAAKEIAKKYYEIISKISPKNLEYPA